MKKLYVLPPSASKRLISTLMSSRSADCKQTKSFSLKCTNEFASRSGSIFGELKGLEKSHEQWVSENRMLEPADESEDSSIVQKDSELFKKPIQTKEWKRKSSATFKSGKRCRKWIKYSLEDIPISSDATNTAIALQCIGELRKRKPKTDLGGKSDNSNEKIVFRQPKHLKNCLSVHDYSVDANSALPSLSEVRKPSFLRKQKETESCSITLGHLYDDESNSS